MQQIWKGIDLQGDIEEECNKYRKVWIYREILKKNVTNMERYRFTGRYWRRMQQIWKGIDLQGDIEEECNEYGKV